MLDRMLDYFKGGFKITNKNFSLVFFKLLMNFLLGGIFMLCLGGTLLVFALMVENAGIHDIRKLGPMMTTENILLGIVVIVLVMVVLTIVYIAYIVLNTGIRASIKQHKTDEYAITLGQVFDNARAYFKRSIYINLVIASYIILAGFILFLILFAESIPIISIPDFADDNPWIVIGFILIDLCLFAMLMLFNVYMHYWQLSSEYQMIFHDLDWKPALKKGREFLFTEWERVILFLLGFFIIGMVIGYVLGIFRVFSVIPIIGIIITIFVNLITLFVRSYLSIYKNGTFVYLVDDTNTQSE